MENFLSTEFGNLGLSSKAREWKPPGAQQQQQQQPPEQLHQQRPPPQAVQSISNEWQHQNGETELNYSMKEFVPGHGWSTQGSSVSNAMNDGKNSTDSKTGILRRSDFERLFDAIPAHYVHLSITYALSFSSSSYSTFS
jgi:hypothetical protein